MFKNFNVITAFEQLLISFHRAYCVNCSLTGAENANSKVNTRNRQSSTRAFWNAQATMTFYFQVLVHGLWDRM